MPRGSRIGLGLVVVLGALSGCSSNNPASGGPDASGDVSLADGGGTDDGGGGGGEAAAPDSGTDASAEGGTTLKVASTPSHGSTLALSSDDSRLVVANHDVGTASVFAVDYGMALPSLTKLAELPVGGEPSAVSITPNGDTAFVLARKDQKLVKI